MTVPAAAHAATISNTGVQNMNSPFVVYPAKVVGGVQNPIYYPDPNVKPHYGVPLALFSAPGDLLRLEIIPWDNQAVNDSGWLIINKGAPLFMKTIQTGEDGRTFFHDVPKAFFNDGINTLVVRVTNQVQPGGTDSTELFTLVHIPRPGGEVPGSGNNPNLTLSVSHLSVGPTEAANGVDVTLRYAYMREGDDINLDLDGRPYPHKVTAAQALLGQVVIKLFAKDFWQDNKQFAIRFRATDSLGNTSGPLAIWSATTNIDVQVKQPALDLLPPQSAGSEGSERYALEFREGFLSEHPRHRRSAIHGFQRRTESQSLLHRTRGNLRQRDSDSFFSRAKIDVFNPASSDNRRHRQQDPILLHRHFAEHSTRDSLQRPRRQHHPTEAPLWRTHDQRCQREPQALRPKSPRSAIHGTYFINHRWSDTSRQPRDPLRPGFLHGLQGSARLGEQQPRQNRLFQLFHQAYG